MARVTGRPLRTRIDTNAAPAWGHGAPAAADPCARSGDAADDRMSARSNLGVVGLGGRDRREPCSRPPRTSARGGVVSPDANERDLVFALLPLVTVAEVEHVEEVAHGRHVDRNVRI